MTEPTTTSLHSCRILVADDDPDCLRLIEYQLTKAGYTVIAVNNAEEARNVLLEQGAEMLLIDWHMPGMSGVELCRALRDSEAIDFVYFIVMTASSDDRSLVEAFNAGADDFISKPINVDELLARLRAGARITCLQSDLARRNRDILLTNAKMAVAARDLETANQKLQVLATTDELTGFLNRRETMTRLNKHWSSSQRRGSSLSVVALDIDRFKQFNDTYGHAVGDVVLREMTKTLQCVARTSDELCRIGGEEFLVICPDTSLEAASKAAERFRVAVELNVIEHGGHTLRVTISLGVAEKTPQLTTTDELLLAADEALYQAKAGGRNCVKLARIGEVPAFP